LLQPVEIDRGKAQNLSQRGDTTMRFMPTQSDLERMIEPLASYICATDQPKAALILALTVLSKEVEQVTGTAKAHIASRLS
jgi:hypothetical protein